MAACCLTRNWSTQAPRLPAMAEAIAVSAMAGAAMAGVGTAAMLAAAAVVARGVAARVAVEREMEPAARAATAREGPEALELELELEEPVALALEEPVALEERVALEEPEGMEAGPLPAATPAKELEEPPVLLRMTVCSLQVLSSSKSSTLRTGTWSLASRRVCPRCLTSNRIPWSLKVCNGPWIPPTCNRRRFKSYPAHYG